MPSGDQPAKGSEEGDGPAGSSPIVPAAQQLRQAVAALRGYAHQLHLSALQWMDLDSGGTLLLEVAEDFATLVGRTLTMSQSKNDAGSGSLTLRTPGARNAIVSLWQFQIENPGLDVRLAYLTTASVGREREFPARKGMCGIDRWRAAAAGEPQPGLRGLLCDLSLPADLLAFVRTASDADLRERLFERLSWNCDAPSLETVRHTLLAGMADRATGVGLLASDGEHAAPAIVEAVLRAIVMGDRRLTRADLDRIFEEATSVSVSRGIARRLMKESGERAAPLRTAPSGPAHHVERPALVESVGLALSRGERIALVGIGGTGKTTLAIRILDDRRVRERYPDGVLWASIGPEGEPSIHLEAWIRMLGAVPPRTEDEEVLAATWRGLLRGRRLLVVVDDVWNFAGIDGLVPPLGCGFLTTGRSSSLAPAVHAMPIEVGRLEGEEALLLLERVSGRRDPDQELGELIDRVEGLALPIVLVGALLRYRSSPAEVVAALNDECLRLSALDLDHGGTGGDDGSRRTISVEASLGLGVRALDERHRTAFYRLATLPQGATFDVAAACAIIGGEGCVATARTLAALVARGLLDRAADEDPNSRSYRMHALLLDYAMTAFGPGRPRVASVPATLPTTMTKLHQELLDRLIAAAGPARWAEVNASSYFDLHLGWHLTMADRPDLLHELLLTPDAAGRAAWASRIRRNGRTAALLGDLVRIVDFAGSRLMAGTDDRYEVAAIASAITTFAIAVDQARTTPIGLLPALVGAELVSSAEAMTRAALAPSITGCWLLAELLPFVPGPNRQDVWSSFMAQAVRGYDFALIGDEELLSTVLPVLVAGELDELVASLSALTPLVHARVTAGMHRFDADRAATALVSFLDRREDPGGAAGWTAGLIHMAAAGVPTPVAVQHLIASLDKCGPYRREAQGIIVLVSAVELAATVRGGDSRTLAHILDPFGRFGRSLPLPVLIEALLVLEGEADAPFRAVMMARICALAGDARSEELVLRTFDLLIDLPDQDWRKAEGLGGLVSLLPEDRRSEAEAGFVRSAEAVGFGNLGVARLRGIAQGLSGAGMDLVLEALGRGSSFDRQVALGPMLEHAPERLLPRIAAAIVAEAGRSGRIGDLHHAAHRIPDALLPLLQDGTRRLPTPDFVEAVRSMMPETLPLPSVLRGWIDDVWDHLGADVRLRVAPYHGRYSSADDAVGDLAVCLIGGGEPLMDALSALVVGEQVLSAFEVSEVRASIGRRILPHLEVIGDYAVPHTAALARYFDEEGRGPLLARVSSVSHAHWAADALVSLARAWSSQRRELMLRAAELMAAKGDARACAEWLLTADDLLDDVIVVPLLRLPTYQEDPPGHLPLSVALYRFLGVEERAAMPARLSRRGSLPRAILDLIVPEAFPVEMRRAFDVSRLGDPRAAGLRADAVLLDPESLLEEDPAVIAAAFDRRSDVERVSRCVDLMKAAMSRDMRVFSRVIARVAPALRGTLGDDAGRSIAEGMARAAALHATSVVPADHPAPTSLRRG